MAGSKQSTLFGKKASRFQGMKKADNFCYDGRLKGHCVAIRFLARKSLKFCVTRGVTKNSQPFLSSKFKTKICHLLQS